MNMTGHPYQPELGQMIFGQPSQSYEGSELLDAALRAISNELDRAMWNIEQEEYSSPFDNTGNRFECDTFKAHAYSWGDDEQPWNFKWRDVEISWYKWSGRGLSTNKPLPPDLISEMLDDCLGAVRRHEREKRPDIY
jgi:hypothetical protein